MNVTLEIKMKDGCEDLFPKQAHMTDACYDIYAAEDAVIPAQGTKPVHTGVHMNIPEGYEVVFRPRSGLFFKYGISSHLGTIDTGYIDECQVIMWNQSDKDYEVKRGDRIAQFKVQKLLDTILVKVDDITAQSRGGGFGSTGN